MTGGRPPIAVLLIVLGLGFWLYTTAATPLNQRQSTLGGLTQAFSQNASAQSGVASTRYYGGIGIMGLGVTLFLLGLFGSKRSKG